MTLFEFYKKFNTDQKCINYLKGVRWPDGNITCVYCGHPKCYIIEKGVRFKCANNKCYKRFRVTVGTIFHASNVPLWQFFYLIYSSAINKKNVSSMQQASNLGIVQKTAWYIMTRIRMLCWQDDNTKLSGEVEVDETYLRMAKWKKPVIPRRSFERKYPVLGLIQRGGGKVVLKVIPSKEKRIVQNLILKHVEVDSKLFTDSAPCYFGLTSYYKHESVNHKEGEYVRGNVHTNNIESFWNRFKVAIRCAHGGVSQVHLQKYCDEFAYRWNNKHLSPEERFNDLMKRACVIGFIRGDRVKLGAVKNSKKTYEHRYKIVDTDSGEVYSTIKEASVKLGISTLVLGKMLNNDDKNTTALKKVHNF